jgi:MFS family permease
MTFSPSDANRTYRKIILRLLPFLAGCFVLAYLDRFNIGFAQLQLAADLHLSAGAYGLGAAMFFIGYLLFEVPANLLLAKIGARLWIARIMIVWGLVSLATAFVHSVGELYIARFFLGAAEAGFFPGVIYYLTLWFPNSRRAQVVSYLTTAIALSGIISGPISGCILQRLSETHGLHGWQWLFLLEGLPSVFAGIAVLFVLDNSVSDARWLADEEKAFIQYAITSEAGNKATMSAGRVFRDARVWQLGFVQFCICMGLYAVGFWLPQLLQKAGAGDALHIGLWSVIPYAVAIPFMIAIAGHSNTGVKQRRWLIVSIMSESIGLVVSALYGDSFPIAMAALTLATASILTAVPLFWTLPTCYLKGDSAAAAGIALVNSIGAIAGFASPYIVGVVKDATHSTAGGLFIIAAVVGVGGLFLLLFPGRRYEQPELPIQAEAARAGA